MKRNSLYVILGSLVCLSACNNFNGGLTLTANTSIKDKKGKVSILPPGSYTTRIEPSLFGKKIRFEIDDNKGTTVKMQMPTIPEIANDHFEGTVRMAARDIGQAFDIEGQLDVRTETTGPFHRTVSCVYDTVYERVCHDEVTRNPDGSTSRREVCETISHTIYGNRDEDYTVTDTDRFGKFQLVNAQTKEVTGSYDGVQNVAHYENIIHSGYCQRSGYDPYPGHGGWDGRDGYRPGEGPWDGHDGRGPDGGVVVGIEPAPVGGHR